MSGKRPVLIAVAALAVFVGFVVLTSSGGSGAKGPQVGTQMPPFAAPLAASDLTGDANISAAACAVRDPRALNSCRAVAGQPLVLGFLATNDGSCRKLPASLQTLRNLQPQVGVAAIGIEGPRDDLAALAGTVPEVAVAWDRDGALANRYGVAVCPTVVVADQGGRVAGVVIGDEALDPPALSARVKSLLASAR